MAKKYDWGDGRKVHSKPKAKTASASPLLTQAQMEKEVQYGPQIDQAKALIGEAADQYKSDIESAKNNEAAIAAFAREQKPGTIQMYKDAAGKLGDIKANTASALEGVGPSADIFRRAITAEQGAHQAMMQGAQTRETQALTDRQTAAQAGRISATNQARTDYRKTKDSLTSQIQSLTSRQAADAFARFGQLAEQEAARGNKIDIAKIGADATKTAAKTRADATGKGSADKAAEKAEADKAKRITGVRKATGDLKRDVANAISAWDTYANQVSYRQNKDPETANKQPYLNANGDPVSMKEHAQQTQRTPSQIRTALAKDVDAGVLHIALLRRANKPLDAQALSYIQANPDWRVPREWLPPKYTHPGVVTAPSGTRGQSRPT